MHFHLPSSLLFSSLSHTHHLLSPTLFCFLDYFVCFSLFSLHHMEPQQQQNHHQPNGNCSGSGKGNCHCRPTCPRWTPTTDQVRILKDLYYNNGVRSPTAEQIQKISAKLRQYGKIEGKNVFYWFQNYKARERLKKKIEGNTNTTTGVSMHRAANSGWKTEAILDEPQTQNISSDGASTPSPTFTVYTVGQMGDHGYGPLIMEKSFRDCSISSGGSGFGGSRCQNIGWVGIDPHPSSYIYFGMKREDHVKEEEEDAPDIETLPLFPMHGEDNINSYYNSQQNSSSYYSGWYGSDDGSSSTSCASLELTLNSYNGRSSGSM